MIRRALLLLLIQVSTLAAAKTETWVRVRTPHFVVLTNSGEKQGRKVGNQLERMRAVFHKAFPSMRVDEASPIVVIAVKDKKDFQALEPQVYLAKGQLNLAGLFLRGPEKNYVLLRLDAEGAHPYATVYHEYTHFTMSRAMEWLPLWLNEGLAQFYENTNINEKIVEIGEPSEANLYLLNQNRLLPLTTLFAVDQHSPYYHEEHKGSIFYAESWALTHYLQINDMQHNTQHLIDYAMLLSNKVDPVTAASRSFGDLTVLEKNLQKYVQQRVFFHLTMPGATEVQESSFKAENVSSNQADAVRADFLAYNHREKDSRALLDRILQEDPNNVSALETMGFLAFREGKLEDSQNWFGKAVKLDSKSFLTHYYFALIVMRQGPLGDRAAEVETSLLTATKLNSSFAPAFDQLAVLYGTQHKSLEDAQRFSLKAIELDPSNLNFRLNRANLLTEMAHFDDAQAVLQSALRVASEPEELDVIRNRLQAIRQFQAMREQEARNPIIEETTTVAEPDPVEPPNAKPEGQPRTVSGTLKGVQCAYPAVMRLQVENGTNRVELHALNYARIEYSALNFKPMADLNPCKDIEGMKAKVVYLELQGMKEGRILSIELSK